MGMNGWPSASNLQDPDRKPTKSGYFVSVSVKVPVSKSNRTGDKRKPESIGAWPTVKPFVNGGASGMLATCVFQPIDIIKTRIQLGQGSAVRVTMNMLKQEGFRAFYKGLSAGLLQQATYTTARLGSFKLLANKTIEANDGKPLTMHQKRSFSIASIAVGACVGCPADLALIRMQADYTLPVAQRRNYKNVFHALYRIVTEEGVLALWKGAGPTVLRTFHTGTMILFVPIAKFFKDDLGFGDLSAITGALVVGNFCTAALGLPFDYIKTQIQKMQADAGGRLPYTGFFDCARKTFKAGGVLKFYTGFPVYCLRGCPHAMMTGIFMVQMSRIEKEYGL